MQKQSYGSVIVKGVPKNFVKFTGKHLCQSLFFNKVAGLSAVYWFKKKTLAQVFFCEFCENFQNNLFHRTPPLAASQKAQNKCIRFCLNLPARSYIDPSHIRKLNWLPVSNRSRILFANTVFKCWNGIVPGYIHEMFKPSFCK